VDFEGEVLLPGRAVNIITWGYQAYSSNELISDPALRVR